MNKTELINQVAEMTQLSKKDVGVVVDATLDAIGMALQKGDSVRLIGFGTFESRRRGERKGKNPRTGEPTVIPATTIPVFRSGKSLKDVVNK